LRFQPYYGYLTGLSESEWNELTPDEHRELIRASKRKTKPVVVEDRDRDSIAVEEKSSLEIRYVSRTELDEMPTYQRA
jgi:hypothetical protein